VAHSLEEVESLVLSDAELSQNLESLQRIGDSSRNCAGSALQQCLPTFHTPVTKVFQSGRYFLFSVTAGALAAGAATTGAGAALTTGAEQLDLRSYLERQPLVRERECGLRPRA
jgi:hypothetical protein